MIRELVAGLEFSTTTAGYWEATTRGVLAIQSCDACSHTQHPRARCALRAAGRSRIRFNLRLGTSVYPKFTIGARLVPSSVGRCRMCSDWSTWRMDRG